ncbi:DivIVA domain-containing protein [Micromonospora rifamycinica]|uniref:DivIVA domain-containing protein n=1 Tax=Micromonospora rifamycinica TaxID=291594 RepID=A0A120F8Z4_9ACTN|nr:DivIVA domain-containing protein [Micromonospora rifamycinica]KWV32617.1 cell division protein DivIVA [Micromonospora rifamycinica]SCG63951.1 DivIVA domain-containing protein [Micromonospora rifamycinica]
MGQTLLIVVVALTVAAVVFGVTVLISGRDGLTPVEPDGRAVPLPGGRPLRESDVGALRFDTALRGYRMAQVDQAFRRAAYDIGYKTELIGVLEAEIAALREGRTAEADALRRTREESIGAPADDAPATPVADGTAPEAPTVEVEPVEPAGTPAASPEPVAPTVRPAAGGTTAKLPAPAPGDDHPDATPAEAGRAGTDRTADSVEDRPGGTAVRSEPV